MRKYGLTRKPISKTQRITEQLRLDGPLGVIWSNPPAQARSPRADSPGPRPGF